MAKNYGSTLTRLIIMPAWGSTRPLVKQAVRELTANGWQLKGGGRADYRCLTMRDADIEALERMAMNNPGLRLISFTEFDDEEVVDVHLGVGGTWAKSISGQSETGEMLMCPREYVHTMGPMPARTKHGEKPRDVHEKKQVATRKPHTQSSRSRRARTATTVPVSNRLVFHGLPGEVERCRALAIDVLPEAARAATKFDASGSESYASGTLEFTTDTELAVKAFNRLVAQVPAVTVVLEYDDLSTGGRRQLRAIDGRIVEHRAV